MTGLPEPTENWSKVPHVFSDEILPKIDTVSELKVTFCIIRQTWGWGKDWDKLSLSRLQELTGLRRDGVIEGLKRALKRGYVTRRKVGQTYMYRVKLVGKPDQLDESTSRQTGPELVGKPDQQLVGKSYPQKKVLKKEKENPTNVGVPLAPQTPKRVNPIKALVDGLEVQQVFLSSEDKEQYAGHVKQLRDKGVADKDILRAVYRVVSDWPRYPFTSLQKALSFVDGNGSVALLQTASESLKASPDCVINALEAYNRDGITDLQDFAPLARKWDFTLSEKPPWEIFRDLGGNDEERGRNLKRIQSVSSRAKRAVG